PTVRAARFAEPEPPIGEPAKPTAAEISDPTPGRVAAAAPERPISHRPTLGPAPQGRLPVLPPGRARPSVSASVLVSPWPQPPLRPVWGHFRWSRPRPAVAPDNP